ncbi:CPCC family cysteine-rich protein [Bacillus pseudomycoides]|uniref:CPCC family cysteine-rich protein n=1 Tax=Bacillus pseudomycoides TaxID=64104 RepID=UPI000BEBC181|nr:hypothetical protein CON86_28690 [Bacillus pseudomycoides]PEM73774.1 hypothetical protein CN632_19790 [Bacillus pseudomycoides]PEO82730.1 hypothetical protein CN571_25225 [Bacillus pseudomycoides]PHC79132.1 hypothetical protein COF63_27750 [Bacillus pseudomycoides]
MCKWNDDEVQAVSHDIRGANKETLKEAQINYKEIGRASKTFFIQNPNQLLIMQKVKIGSQ